MVRPFCPPLLALALLLPLACGDDGAASTSASSTTGAASDTDASTASSSSGSGSTSDGSGSGTTGDATETGAPVTGESLFLEKCASCHGPAGEGSKLGYEIQHPIRDFSSWVVRNGRQSIEFPGTEMPAFAVDEIDDAEPELIWDFLDEPAQPSEGVALYMDYCRNCHGVDASGGVSNRNIRSEPPPAMIFHVRMGAGGTNYGSRTAYMPPFPTSRISDAELDALVAAVPTL